MDAPEAQSAAIPLIQYWHADEVPEDIQRLFSGFSECNPEMRHIVFSERTADEFIAEHFGPREVAAFRSCAVPAMQADYLRYCAVFALGGVYADADWRCVGSLRSLIDGHSEGHLFREPNGVVINGFFAFRRQGHPMLRLTLDIATTNIEKRLSGAINQLTGPFVFTALERLHEIGSLEAMRTKAQGGRSDHLLEPFLKTVGSYARVRDAFEGVRISPIEASQEWIGKPRSSLAYKFTEDHWLNFTASVYR